MLRKPRRYEQPLSSGRPHERKSGPVEQAGSATEPADDIDKRAALAKALLLSPARGSQGLAGVILLAATRSSSLTRQTTSCQELR